MTKRLGRAARSGTGPALSAIVEDFGRAGLRYAGAPAAAASHRWTRSTNLTQ